MKRTGILLTFILFARITSAQTEVILGSRTEQNPLLDKHNNVCDNKNNDLRIAPEKKHMLSSAARKSALTIGKSDAMKEDLTLSDHYSPAQAKRPFIAGKPPKISLPVLSPSMIAKPGRMFILPGRIIPSIGKY